MDEFSKFVDWYMDVSVGGLCLQAKRTQKLVIFWTAGHVPLLCFIQLNVRSQGKIFLQPYIVCRVSWKSTSVSVRLSRRHRCKNLNKSQCRYFAKSYRPGKSDTLSSSIWCPHITDAAVKLLTLHPHPQCIMIAYSCFAMESNFVLLIICESTKPRDAV